eukprot:2191369-Rhodomonas_salina.1
MLKNETKLTTVSFLDFKRQKETLPSSPGAELASSHGLFCCASVCTAVVGPCASCRLEGTAQDRDPRTASHSTRNMFRIPHSTCFCPFPSVHSRLSLALSLVCLRRVRGEGVPTRVAHASPSNLSTLRLGGRLGEVMDASAPSA